LIGITRDFIEGVDDIGRMDWAGIDSGLPSDASKWHVLAEEFATDSEVIPVVLDKNTAMYSMQIYTGVGTEFERDYGPAGVLKFRIVGLLSGSIFQGSLLVSESDLEKHFPRIGGYRYFLVDTTSESVAVANQLEETYSDEGLDLTDTHRLLSELLAVQNTYLSTFQSLGGLGLLLGTLGLAAVQLRNVIQRRGELAILRATGFRNDQLSLLILREHALLLLGGLAVGVVAALVVIFPHILFGGATVPIASLVVTLGLVTIVGLASALFAQRYLQKMPLLPSLRGD
jgi:ABC-type antimicrobial peptide transport system permease subunit